MDYDKYETAVCMAMVAQMGFRTIYYKIDADTNGIAALLGDEVLQSLIPHHSIKGEEIEWPITGNNAQRVCEAHIAQVMDDAEWETVETEVQSGCIDSLREWAENVASATEILWDAHMENKNDKEDD